MSHNPPPGGPPPYGYGPGHPYPPPAGGYAYVPAPAVMMPMPVYQPPPPPEQPPTQSTYVTNYIYQTPLDTVQVVEDALDWIPTTSLTARNLGGRAVVGGHEGWDGSPLWVIRAQYGGDCIPGKYAAKHGRAFIAYGGKEVTVHNFDVLVAQPHLVQWLSANNGQVPSGAIPAGNTQTGEPLYIGRARHLLSLTPGKVHPSHASCYISYGGDEISYRYYEVLCRV